MKIAKMTGSVVVAQQGEKMLVQTEKKRLFKPGERARLTESPFAGMARIYQMTHGEPHAMMMIELFSKQLQVLVAPLNLRKVD